MTLREYLRRLTEQGRLQAVSPQIQVDYEIAGVLKKLEPAPVIFTNVAGYPFRVAGNLFASKAAFADYLGVNPGAIIPLLSQAIDRRLPPTVVNSAPCQEVVIQNPDLDDLPLLWHCQGDGGRYISSGVMIAHHPQYGVNVDFHRCMQISKRELAVRVVRGRHFDRFLQELGQVDVVICVGLPPNILAAAATSVEIGINELEIAHALEPFAVTPAISVPVMLPAEAEFVLEGTVYADRLHAEGPFVDLTETQDVVRQQPVLEVKTITYRRDAIWHALLPGGLEHKLLMGMPREPTIFKKVNEVVRCLDVNINPGGCSWLHAIVQIDKQYPEDGRRAIEAAFAGHRSCKHVFVVDRDIDIYDPLQVEWAMATRFQGDRDLVMITGETGSSLDPSASPGDYRTTKLGFDLTRPLETGGKAFGKVPYPEVDITHFLRSE